MTRALILILGMLEVLAVVALAGSTILSGSAHERTFALAALATAALILGPALMLAAQRRRLGLALALVVTPPLLVLGAAVLLFQMVSGW